MAGEADIVARLAAQDLAARRAGQPVFAGISFALDAGCTLTVTGANGSGKSTLLRVLAGLLAPAAGMVRVQEHSGKDRPAGESCHYLGHANAMKHELSVRDNLSFWARLMATDTAGPALGVEDAVEAMGLGAVAHLPFGCLSAGQQRRIAMARLLVAYRPVWLLDEPTAALDSASEATVAALVAAHCAHGGIAVATTHRPLDLVNAHRLEMSGYRPTVETSDDFAVEV